MCHCVLCCVTAWYSMLCCITVCHSMLCCVTVSHRVSPCVIIRIEIFNTCPLSLRQIGQISKYGVAATVNIDSKQLLSGYRRVALPVLVMLFLPTEMSYYALHLHTNSIRVKVKRSIFIRKGREILMF